MFGIPKVERRESGTRGIFKEIKTENFLYCY